MRILHAFKDYYPPTRGGVELHINEVVHSLYEDESVVLTSSGGLRSSVDKDGPVTVFRASEYWRPVSTPITPSWRKLLKQTSVDILHFHMPNPFGELTLLSARTHLPMIATYHADIVGRRALTPFFGPFQQAFLQKAEQVVVGSTRLLDSAISLREHRKKAVVIPYGVDTDFWRQRPSAVDEIRERMSGRHLVLFLGRISYYKGVEVLIQAMREVNATCLVLGEGPFLSGSIALSKALGLGDKVVFLTNISNEERRDYYHAADVFVLPSTSRAESFGISMLEAMASGTPAVSTELGTGTSWVNQHGKTGLVVEANSPKALAAALNQLLLNESLRTEMGQAAAERAQESFRKQSMLDSLDAVYSSL